LIRRNETITDYAPLINSALQSFRATGGAVRLMNGSYPIASQIKMYSNTCLMGAGVHLTLLVVKDAASFDQAGGVVMAEFAERVSLIGLVRVSHTHFYSLSR